MARVEAAAASPQRAVLPQHAQLQPPQSLDHQPGKLQGNTKTIRRPVAPYIRPAPAQQALVQPGINQMFPAVQALEVGVPQMELHIIDGQQVFVAIP